MLQNCWQMKSCGREPDGSNAAELGICPAAADAASDGVNHGSKAGRVCWAIAGTLCAGQVQGSSAAKRTTCLACEFYSMVHDQEGEDFRIRP